LHKKMSRNGGPGKRQLRRLKMLYNWDFAIVDKLLCEEYRREKLALTSCHKGKSAGLTSTKYVYTGRFNGGSSPANPRERGRTTTFKSETQFKGSPSAPISD